MMPKITVIVPVYNAEAYLQSCLSGIVRQSYRNTEIIVVNDGSTDGSLAIIDEFSHNDVRVRAFSQINSGISQARNTGLSYATGDFITFVDSDDWIDEHMLSTMLEKATGHDLVCCGYMREFRHISLPRYFNIDGKIGSYDFKSMLLCPQANGVLDPGSVDALTTVWGKLYKTSIIKQSGIEFVPLQEIGTGEDLLFNLSYIDKASDVYVIDEPLYHYRKYNSDSITTRYKSELKIKWQRLYSAIRDSVGVDKHHLTLFNYRLAMSTVGLGLNEINNPKGLREIYKKISMMISSDVFTVSYRILPLDKLKLPWRVFFFCARYGLTINIYILLKVLKAIINRGN